jgi:hypothetical protein
MELPPDVLDFLKMDYPEALEQMKLFKKLVRKQKRVLSRKYHPDKPGGNLEKMKAVNNVVDYIQTLVIEPPRPQPVFFRFIHTGTSASSTAAWGF